MSLFEHSAGVLPRSHSWRECGLKSNLNQLFTLIGGRDHHRLPILGNGSARDLDILVREEIGELAVRQRFAGIFFCDQVLDQGPDRGG